jgi:hypothetical protein
MSKKFRMPPPILPVKPDAKRLWADADDPAQINSALNKSGLLPLHMAICKRFEPYVQKKLEAVEQVKELDERALKVISSACTILTLFYLGRRVGNFIVRFADSDEDGRPMNDTGLVISACLNQLKKALGEKQATQLFRKLEKITDEVLEHEFGRSRGK